MAPLPRSRRTWAALTGLALLLPALAGCQSAAETTGAVYPEDVRDRHPIVLSDKPRILDVFVDGSGIGARQQRDVRAFVDEYRQYGKGPLLAQVPGGGVAGQNAGRALAALRNAVGGRMAISRYEPLDPGVASPIRLSFRRLSASVGSQCGIWPQDLGVDDYKFGWSNSQYWNFGCAMQSNLAQQVADPVDLVRGRVAAAPDTQKRMRAFEQLRAGSDPSTTYKQEAAGFSK